MMLSGLASQTNAPVANGTCCPDSNARSAAVNSLSGFFGNLFDTSSYPARWNCGSWTPLEGWLHIVSDLLIFAAYFAIPISILYLAVRRKDVPFNSVFFLFASFILLCGTTHLIEAIIFYYPIYRVAGLFKATTAVVSLATFFVLLKIIPRALELPKLVGQNEQLQQIAKAKSEFLANMSHEIRTPMTAIVGNLDLMEEALASEDVETRAESLSTIRRNTEHLLAVVNDILDLSKIEVGRVTVEQIATCPPLIVDDVASLARAQFEKKGVAFRVAYDSAIPNVIYTDPTRLKQILLNLLSNASKFTETGQVELRVEVSEGSFADDRLLKFSVIDTGIGMTPEELAVIEKFDAFAQGDASITRRFGGTGLGLRISNSLAGMLGGKIEIESSPGVGSVFCLSIPTADLIDSEMMSAADCVEQIRRTQPSTGQVSEAQSLAGLRVLLAEDGEDNQRLVRTILERAGASVTVAGNGEVACQEAVACLNSGEPFDVILMDMQMPVMNGYSAARELRQRGYAGGVVALTAHAMPEVRELCRDAGCDAFETKPIDRKRLIETIHRCATSSGAATAK